MLGPAEAAWLLVSFAVPLAVVFLITPAFLSFLKRQGRVADDVHKSPPVKVPSPMGPVLFAAAVAGEAAAYLFLPSAVPLAVLSPLAIAFVVGLYDDLSVLGGKTKPLLLVLASLPIVALQLFVGGVYDPRLYFPLVGATGTHFLIYTVLVIASLPIVTNAFNMIDSFNGALSGFALLTGVALVAAVVLRAYAEPHYSLVHVAAALPLAAVALGFYAFNRYPSKAFDGNSGSLMLGAMFVALAITCGVEIAALVAIIPAVLNSFYILSSVRGFVERRRMQRPTSMGPDGKLYASDQKDAPTTLIRMILLDGPLSERGVVSMLLGLTAVACILSAVTAALTWVV